MSRPKSGPGFHFICYIAIFHQFQVSWFLQLDNDLQRRLRHISSLWLVLFFRFSIFSTISSTLSFLEETSSCPADCDSKLQQGRIKLICHQDSGTLTIQKKNHIQRSQILTFWISIGDTIFDQLLQTKLIAWIVSNCDTHSNREDYVEILKKYVQVDTFGACGKLTCSRTEDHNTRDCDLMLERDYR